MVVKKYYLSEEGITLEYYQRGKFFEGYVISYNDIEIEDPQIRIIGKDVNQLRQQLKQVNFKLDYGTRHKCTPD